MKRTLTATAPRFAYTPYNYMIHNVTVYKSKAEAEQERNRRKELKSLLMSR